MSAVAEKSQTIELLNYPECTFATTGLIIPPGMKFERWQQLGNDLRAAAKGIQFWIGDWIRYGEHEYGEKYAQAIEATGREEKTLRNYVYVAENVDLSRRRDNVDFSIHAEVASLPPKKQEEILSRAAADDEYNVKRARKEARREKRRLNQIPDELNVIHTPEVQEFLSGYIEVLQKLDDEGVPPTGLFLRNMIEAHIGQAQWQKDRTIEGDYAVIRKAAAQVMGDADDIYMTLIKYGYFMSDPDLESRLAVMARHSLAVMREAEDRKKVDEGKLKPQAVRAHMCDCTDEHRQLKGQREEGKKKTQRGQMRIVYLPIYTGDEAEDDEEL